MKNKKGFALAHPNIAFIKYWGNTDDVLRLPSNGSISMNLDNLNSTTSVEFSVDLNKDSLKLNGHVVEGQGLKRVSDMLSIVRNLAEINLHAEVVSNNNFPTGSGIASSASAFAALALASSTAAGLKLNEAELSRLARTGSGSASRSIPSGFVEWTKGEDHESSYSKSILAPHHWKLVDNIAIVSKEHKKTGSSSGHPIAKTSPIQAGRVADAPRRLDLCRNAIIKKDFSALAKIAEIDSNLLHSVMLTSTPQLIYWQPATIDIMRNVQEWRASGVEAFYTIDAGPNVHVISTEGSSEKVVSLLKEIDGVQEVITSTAGGAARLL